MNNSQPNHTRTKICQLDILRPCIHTRISHTTFGAKIGTESRQNEEESFDKMAIRRNSNCNGFKNQMRDLWSKIGGRTLLRLYYIFSLYLAA